MRNEEEKEKRMSALEFFDSRDINPHDAISVIKSFKEKILPQKLWEQIMGDRQVDIDIKKSSLNDI